MILDNNWGKEDIMALANGAVQEAMESDKKFMPENYMWKIGARIAKMFIDSETKAYLKREGIAPIFFGFDVEIDNVNPYTFKLFKDVTFGEV